MKEKQQTKKKLPRTGMLCASAYVSDSPFMAVFGCQRQTVQTYHCLMEEQCAAGIKNTNPSHMPG
jgi:hypothetical protein